MSAACHLDGKLHVRLEGGAGSVRAALERIGGEHLDPAFWTSLREHRLAFFDDPRPLWRLSLPNDTPLAALPGAVLHRLGRRATMAQKRCGRRHRFATRERGRRPCDLLHATPDIEPFHPLAIR